MLHGALPKAVPAPVLTNWSLWSPQVFTAIVRYRWYPLMRVNAQDNFRPL